MRQVWRSLDAQASPGAPVLRHGGPSRAADVAMIARAPPMAALAEHRKATLAMPRNLEHYMTSTSTSGSAPSLKR